MKVQELLSKRVLLEEVTEVTEVYELEHLINPETGKYYTGEVNVQYSVELANENLTILPVKFDKIGGDFNCSDNKLTSLKNGPVEVNGYFSCSDNKLTSLKGAPQKVNKSFNCSRNDLTSLEGIPSEMRGFFCSRNKLTSLKGIHKLIKRIDGDVYLQENPIESGGIGFLLIEGITDIMGGRLLAFKIIKKYLGQGKKGLLLCQEELIENGYEEYAKL